MDNTKLKNIEDAWLNLDGIDIDKLFNPCEFVKPTDDDFEYRLSYLMSRPEYFSFLCKHILNIQLLPTQCVMLEELWTRKFPMLVATRGFGKSFTLSLYAILRALLLKGRKIVIVGSGFRQSKVLYEYMDTIWRNAPLLRDICNERSGPKRENDRCSMIINDSSISALPLGDGCLSPYTEITYDDCFGTISDDINGVTHKFIKKRSKKVWGNKNFNITDEAYCNGLCKTKIIKTKSGFQFESTYNHKMKILRNGKIEWVRADEMIIGDHILIDRSYRWHNGHSDVTKEQAYALGLLTGDGCYTQKYRLLYATKDKELVDSVDVLLSAYPNGNKKLIWQGEKDSYHYRCESIHLLKWLKEEFELVGNYAHEKEFPKSILRAEREKVTEFIKGLYDTDGHIQVNTSKSGTGITVGFTNTSEKLVDQLQYILLHYGIVATKISRDRNKNWRTVYELLITGQDIKTFYEEIGFGLKRKQDILLASVRNKQKWFTCRDGVPNIQTFMVSIARQNRIKRGGGSKVTDGVSASKIQQKKTITRDLIDKFLYVYYEKLTSDQIEWLSDISDRSIYYDTITDIENSECITYDIHVPITHEYCANGFFSHNSKIRGQRAHDIIADEFACLGKESIIQTDIGLVKIEDYLKGDAYSLINMNGELETPERIFKTPKIDVYKVTTQNGYSFRCSEIHSVMTINGWKKCIDLTKEDWLELEFSHYFPQEEINGLDSNTAWLMGILVSEGTVTNRNYISIKNTDKNLIDKIKSNINFQWEEVYKDSYLDPRGWSCNESWELKYSDTKYRTTLRDFGIDYVTSHDKEIPAKILQSPKHIIQSFLSGLYEGDGSAFNYYEHNKKRIGLAYYSVSEKLIDQLQILLLKFGVITSKTKKKSKISTNDNWMLAARGENAKKLYDILSIIKWDDKFDNADFFVKKPTIRKNGKRFVVSTYKNNKNYHITTCDSEEDCYKAFEDFWSKNRVCMRVKEVVKLSEQEHLYDFYMPKTNSFIANGFVQHNSIPRDIFENVVAGFAAVTASPIENVKRLAAKKKAKEYNFELEEEETVLGGQLIPNQIILSGTAYYDFNHFAEYWKKWKMFIKSGGDKHLLREAFNGEDPPEDFNYSHYSVLRIPYELTPKGFMDADQVARSKATVHSGIYQMEFGACGDYHTPVITNRGVIPIGEINVGDFVYTHLGRFKRVNEVYTNYHNGKMCEISCYGYNQKLKFTPEHPFLNTDGDFTPISDLDDFLCLPKLRLSNLKELDLTEFLEDFIERDDFIYTLSSMSKINNNQIKEILLSNDSQNKLSKQYQVSQSCISYIKNNKIKPKNSVPKRIQLDYNFGVCLGYYASEGSIGGNGRACEFALDGHVDKSLTVFIDQLKSALFNTFGLEAKLYKKKKNTVSVNINSRLVADLFKYLCPGICYNKIIKNEILFSNKDLLRGFIVGVWNGDGHINGKFASIQLANEDLINQIKMALSHFGINGSILEVYNKKSPTWKLNLSGADFKKFINNFYELKFNNIDSTKDKITYKKDLLANKIKKKEYKDFNGYVYNLDVEDDHSYCTPIAAVHNCFTTDSQGFFKRSLIESCVPSISNPIKTLNNQDISFEPMLIGDKNKKYVFGVDPASEIDNFSIVVIELNPDHRRVVNCWTTNRSEHKELQKSGSVKEKDFYAFCARKIRDLMKKFQCVHIAMDAQGGGIAVMEALHDDDKIKPGELPIWPVIDRDKPADTDGERGLHILEMCQFARYEWLSEANHGMKKDLEDKVLLFPYFDGASVGFSIADDKLKGRKYETLEDCILDIEELKNEMSIIEISQSPSGRDKWDTPETIVGAGKKVRSRKDRYSALLMANMAARIIQRTPDPVDYEFYGGFAQSRSPRIERKKSNNELFNGPAWFTDQMKNVY